MRVPTNTTSTDTHHVLDDCVHHIIVSTGVLACVYMVCVHDDTHRLVVLCTRWYTLVYMRTYLHKLYYTSDI